MRRNYLNILVIGFLALAFYLQIEDRLTPNGDLASADLPSKIQGGVATVAFSSEGDTLASAGKNGQITLWDVASGKRLSNLARQPGAVVTGLSFSPDGGILASTVKDVITLWDVASGQQRKTLQNPTGAPVTGLSFSPNGGILASVGSDAQITLWNLASGAPRRLPSSHQDSITALVFSPDGTLLASGGKDAAVRLWDVATGRERSVLLHLSGAAVTGLVFSPDGAILASAGEDAQVTLWDTNSGSAKRTLVGHGDVIRGIAFSPDGAILASGGKDAHVKLWDVASGRERLTLLGPFGSPVTGVMFDAGGGTLASVGEDARILLWDVVSGQLRQILAGHNQPIVDIAILSDRALASASADGRFIVWEMATGIQRLAVQVPVPSPSPDGSTLTSAESTSAAPGDESRNAATPEFAVSPQTPDALVPRATATSAADRAPQASKSRRADRKKGITALALSPDGSRLGSAGDDGVVRLWDASANELFALAGHSGRVLVGMAFSAGGQRLASAGRDTEIRVWDATTGQQTQMLLAQEHPIRTLAASPDGQFLASAGEETRIMLWGAATGKLRNILNGHRDFINSVAFSPDSKLLASAGADTRILVWDVTTGKILRTLIGHSDEINAVAFSPDGKFLASAGQDQTVILWNATTGQIQQTLTGHQAPIRALAFSQNSKTLASAGQDSQILAWNTANGKPRKIPTGTVSFVNTLVFQPNGRLLVGDEANEISVWDVENGKKTKAVKPTKPPKAKQSSIQSSVDSPERTVFISDDEGRPLAGSMSKSNAPEANPGVLERLLNWFLPAAHAAIPAPPGGPILVITSNSYGFRDYYAEILRTEGFNAFTAADISTMSPATLATYDVAILVPAPLSADQVTLLTDWVTAGGNLIAMKPDKQLANLLGLADAGSTLSEGYLMVDTSKAPGNGIVNQTIQFHGTADRYNLNDATSVAMLYTSANTSTANPAVTLRNVGTNGGQAAAFTYDLATSIVYTRQGNPAWATQERDGFSPIRSNDKFYGAASGDPQSDWVDLNKVAIPQADEQQRLLANLILEMNADKKPLPRFWYFPNGKKAVVIMTGDDHGNNGTAGRFDQFKAASPATCSVKNWECVRGTSYIFPNTPLTDAQAAAYHADGFEVGLHLSTNCADFTQTQLEAFYSDQIVQFTSKYTSIPAPITQRHHCIAWSDWVTGAKVQLANGIRLDTSYYYWPPSWVINTPGLFTGSAMPMRFVDLDGALIDVYHAATQMTDESGQSYPFTIDTLLDRALGSEGYYGAFTINAHTDLATIPESDAVLASAPAKGVPIVSSKQMLDWLDFRDSSSFGSLAWSNGALNFTVVPGAGSQNVPDDGLQVLLPVKSATGLLAAVTQNGNPITFTNQAVKGVDYAVFTGTSGAYVATYAADTTPPTVTSTSPAAGATGIGQGTSIAVTFNEAIDAATITTSAFELRGPAPDNALVLATISYNASTRTATLTPSASLASLTTYTATVKGGANDPRVKDLAGNALGANVAWSFTTAAQPCASAPCSAWSSSTTPGTPSVNDPSSVELGVKFRTEVDGFITGVRFYQANAGTYTGTLWSLDGQPLATGTVTATASGWQQVAFPAPVAIAANTVYVASYHAPNGNYAATNSPQFSTAGVDNGPIHLLQDGVSGGNGVYAYSASSTFPTNTYNGSNYWVDVAFTTSTGPDTTPPTVTARNPASGASGVATGTLVTATFSEAIDAATINTSTFELRNASNALVTATVAYNAATRTATLTPSAVLANEATYTATLKGGTTDPRVKDLAGNALAANASWSFTTTGATPVGCTGGSTIWAATTTPAVAADSDTGAVELGVKFRPTVNGYICGVRFYKGTGNSGTHVGKLWSSTGILLASATFTNETASGWQQVDFASPVAVTANSVYVASYHAPVGRYAVNSNYFSAGVTNGPLYALSNSESGGNGVFLYGSGGFPTNTYQSTNYWVDVVFTTSTGPDTTPPTVTATLPASSATGVNPANPVTATFSEAMNATTITSSTFELRDPGGTLVPATVSYAANTATLTPTNGLTASTGYSAKILGGTGGVKDLAGNALAADFTWSFTTGVDPCSSGGNPIVCENAKPGNLSSEWDVSGAGDSSIQGYATDISVNRGETVRFKINTPSTDYRLDIYRLGYYGGAGARKVATVQPSASLPQTQPNCLTDAATGLIDCGNWAESASWATPSDAVSGIYFAKAVREDGANTGASHIAFIVRDDASTSDFLFQTSDTTWQAYNTYGGNSFYAGSPVGRAYKVSYNRPFNTRSVDNGQDWLFNAEYPMVRWLEANGYDVSYSTGVDSDRRGNLIQNHKVFLSVGHDEYWSGQQRANVEAARDAGVHLAFFSGNEVFWKTRWENSIDGAGTAYRTLVCYKETHVGAKIDPLPNVWTGTWRDPRFSPPADGGKPENALTGTIFMANDVGTPFAITVPEADGKLRFWRNTSIASLGSGQTATLPTGTLGYEWDSDVDNGARPAGLIRMSTTTITFGGLLLDYGSTYGSGTLSHYLTLYKHSSGARVFAAGTIQWPWGLDANHDRSGTPTDVRMQQATVNLFADMGVQPATLQSGLVASAASTDLTAPTSTITTPTANSTVQPGSVVTITGTASDAVGGLVGGVEVSVDGGTTWRWANGRASWTYAWTAPSATGSVTIRSRAADDSGNLETPGTGITVTVGSGLDTTPPTAPAGLSATAASATQINLAWTASTDNVAVTGYRVERCQGAGCSSFAQIATPTAASFADTGLTEGTTYRYRVRATDAAGNLSAYSSVVTATPDATAPTAPTGLNAAATSTTQISLTWTASTDNVAVTGYRVERCQGAGCSNFAQIATPTAASFADSGLTAATIYQYRVRATDAAGNPSGYSDVASATTQSAPALPTAVNDTFLYRANVVRTVNAPGPLGLGVLANDTHPGNLPLTAQLVTGSLSGGGTLNLAADGSFTYLRTSNSNTVSFRYRANDGSASSEPATGATVNLRVDAAPTTVADNCSYDRSANTVTQSVRCTVTGPRVVRMNVVLNDTDTNVTTNAPTDGIGKTVVPSTMVITAAGAGTLTGPGVIVNANASCGQGALGTTAGNATIVNNCDGTLTVTMTTTNTQNIVYQYRVSDDLGAQSGDRSVTLSSVQ